VSDEEVIRRVDAGYCRRVLEEMVSIPSIVGEEGPLAEYLKARLEELGLKPRLQRVEGERFNVIASHRFSDSGRLLMYNGHLDTVPVCEGWTLDPFRPTVRGEALYGLGSMDMKAGIACILAHLKAIMDAEIPLKGIIAFTGVVDEEGHSKGARALLRSEMAKADAVVIGEPYTGIGDRAVPLGITGKLLYELRVRGRAAHGFSPSLGVNAIEEAARILVSLDRLELRSHPRFGVGNTCTLKIEGGYRVYSVVVPDLCRVEVNRLLVPGESSTTAIQDMRRLIDSLGLKAEVDVELKPPYYEPFEMDGDLPIVKIFSEAFREVHGRDPEFQYAKSITDGNVFMGEGGIPTIHYGPGGSGAHQPDEHVDLRTLTPTIMVYIKTTLKFLSGERMDE
jgi:acetylornithine deacetylase/succinyl-diaminopimelate desuccinylase family protein